MNLLPGGKARAEKLTTLEVGDGRQQEGQSPPGRSPASATRRIPVWADANNKFFGFSFFLSWLPEEYAGEHQRLDGRADDGAGGARAGAAQVAAQDARRPGGVHERAGVRRGREACSSPIRPWSSTRA